MPRFSQEANLLLLDQSDLAQTVNEKGRIFEQLACELFEPVPGIEQTERNERNIFNTEEIDVAFWNNQHENGFNFLPPIIFVECKNWSQPVGSQEVSYFVHRLRTRGLSFGVLLAANGITGNPAELTDSHSIIASALRERISVIVITRQEIAGLTSAEEFIALMKRKILRLHIKATSLL